MGFIVYFALNLQGSYDFEAQELAFWFLVDASRRLPFGFFGLVAHDEIRVFDRIVTDYAPAISSHLQDEVFSAICYLIPRWFLSLFVFSMPDEVLTEVWDKVLFPKSPYTIAYPFDLVWSLHRVAFALLVIHSGPLLSQAKSAESALNRIPRRYSGSALEATLLQHRASRLGLEFMQTLVEEVASMSHPIDTARLLEAVEQSPLTIERFRDIRAKVLHKSLELERKVRFVIRIQRWFRLAQARRTTRHGRMFTDPIAITEIFTACAGGGAAPRGRRHRRNSSGSGSCSIQ